METYCVKCESMVHLEEGLVFGHLVFIPIFDDLGRTIGVDVDLCEFPLGFTHCPPPPVDPEWVNVVAEVGYNELEVDLDSLEPDYLFELPELVEA